ncbi:MAG: metal-dependent hydrolase [Defluviitaleaceae bacterium]|nr:metal-dependent hydrolase [Defluviitaleaceae bacterium]
MTGKSHSTIGIATGLAFTIYGVTNSAPEYALAMFTAPLFAMLPDIDHNNSKIGRIRKKTTKFVAVACFLALLAAASYYGWYLANYILFAVLTLSAILPVVLIFLINKTKTGKRLINFTVKHRGIMHTFIMPAGLLFLASFVSQPLLLILLYGSVAGYVSHIIADCLTKHGCPILFPLTTKNIRFARVVTGSANEAVATVALVALIIAIPVVWFLLLLFNVI